MKYHCALDIEGFLATTKFPKGFERMLKHPNGQPMSAREAQSELFAQLKMGHTYMRVGECDNFSPEHGCMGHPEDPVPNSKTERTIP